MNLLIYLVILTSQCVCVQYNVVTVNSNNGSDKNECCIHGECTCSSLSISLLNIDNNTIINITSESVTLNNTTTMGSGKLTNIKIFGSNVTIICNNSGSLYCESCDDVTIEGITWDRCGNPSTNIAGVTFSGTSNISLVNCTFQHSQLPAVALLEVSDYILIQSCQFLSNIPLHKFNGNFGILSITRSSPQFLNSSYITAEIFDSYFYNNGYLQSSIDNIMPSLRINIFQTSVFNCSVILTKSTFMSNRNAIYIGINVLKFIDIQLTEVLVVNNSLHNGYTGAGIMFYINSDVGDVNFSILSSSFSDNYGGNLWCYPAGNEISFTISSSNFTNSKSIVHSTVPTIVTFFQAISQSKITLYKVLFSNNANTVPEYDVDNDSTGFSISTTGGDVNIDMYMVNFTSNKYLGNHGNILHITPRGNGQSNCNISLKQCVFVSNLSPVSGAVLYISMMFFDDGYVQIVKSNFDQNIAGNGVVYITQNGCTQESNDMEVFVSVSEFTNNVASSMYLSACQLGLSGIVLFKNNTAKNGGAMYVDQGTIVTIDDNTTVQFISNTATLNGGAIYVNLLCNSLRSDSTFGFDNSLNCSVMFINNSATIAGNSIYLSIPEFCSVNTNISDSNSILYVPCHFNYSQLVNGTMMNIPCNISYTMLNGTGAPIVTSPHELRLYFPFSDGYNISATTDRKIYFVRNNILGHPMRFTGAVFDYFGKPTQPTLFNIQLRNLHCLYNTNFVEYSFIGGNHKHLLMQSIDNVTILNVNFQGKKIGNINRTINLTLTLTSLAYSHDDVNATLIVEIVPCINHPGYTYNEISQTCVCYHANVKCHDDGNEINRGLLVW